MLIGSSVSDFLRGAVDLFFGTAVGIGQGAGELSWQAAAQSTKFTVETIEEATGSETLGTLVAGLLGAGVIFLLGGTLDQRKGFGGFALRITRSRGSSAGN